VLSHAYVSQRFSIGGRTEPGGFAEREWDSLLRIGGNYRIGLARCQIFWGRSEVDVDFPEVSGLEHLQMLLARSELHSSGHLLENEQKKRLARAVRKLLQQAQSFYEVIQ